MRRSSPLARRLLLPPRHDRLVEDCTALVALRIERQPVWRRVMFKAGIAVLNAIKADAVRHIVIDMLPRYTDALEPLFEQFHCSGGEDFSDFLLTHRETAAAALLTVTDARVRSYGNAAVATVYAGLRPSAEQEVLRALPELAALLGQHLQASCAA